MQCFLGEPLTANKALVTRGATRRFNKGREKKRRNKRRRNKKTKKERERERERDRKILMLFINRFLMYCSGRRGGGGGGGGGVGRGEGLWSGGVALAAV